jgi:ABC-2 type transport system permease protein
VLLPIEQGPGWLYAASRFNPLTYLVEGERALFAGQFFTVEVGYASVVVAITLIVGLVVGGFAIRRSNL